MSPVVRQVIEGAWGENQPWFDEYIVFRKGRSKLTKDHRAQGITSRRGLIAKLRKLRVDMALLTTNSWWTAAVCRLGRARKVVGYDRDARGFMLHDRIPVPREANGNAYAPISAVDYYLELAHWIGCDTEGTNARSMQLSASEDDLRLADQMWREVGFHDDVPTVVVNSNSAKDSARVWPESHVIELSRRLAERQGVQVLLHCGPGERESANRIAETVGLGNVASMGHTEDLPISLSRGVLKRAAVVVSTDSGARHMAVALDRPVVSLFGPTSPKWTRTYNVREVELAENLDCRPCYEAECPLKHHGCMQNLSVTRVMSAVVSRLNSKERDSVHQVAESSEATSQDSFSRVA